MLEPLESQPTSTPLVIDNDISSLTDNSGVDNVSQLEELQKLLEKAHFNEEIATKRVAKIDKSIREMEVLLKEKESMLAQEKNKQDTLLQQNNKYVKMLKEHQATVKALHAEQAKYTTHIENLIKERDKALVNSKEEKIENTKLRLTLDEMQFNLQTFINDHNDKINALQTQLSDESARMKNIIFKQHQILQSKDNEIAQLKNQIETLKTYSSHKEGCPVFFKPAMADRETFSNRNDPYAWKLL